MGNSTIQFDPTKDMNLFHVRDVPRPLLPLWYKRIFDQVYRYVLTRHERRPLLIICDECWIASMLDTLRARGITAAKDLRNYRAGIIFADQHVEVYFTVDATLPGIAGAVRHKFFFHLEGRGVQLIQDAYGQQLPTKLAQQLPQLDRGECVALVDGEARRLKVTFAISNKRRC